MDEFVKVIMSEKYACVVFYVELDEVMQIGQRLEEINENAYMNGENWSAVLAKYLELNEPEIAEMIEHDPEAGLYSAYFEPSEQGKAAAERTADILRSFISSPDELYGFVEEYGDEIEWD